VEAAVLIIRNMTEAELTVAAVAAIRAGAKETARAIAREQGRRLREELQPSREAIRRTVAETKKEMGK
jgi:hypothetical protein